jgi:hypothetical protein
MWKIIHSFKVLDTTAVNTSLIYGRSYAGCYFTENRKPLPVLNLRRVNHQRGVNGPSLHLRQKLCLAGTPARDWKQLQF